MRILNFYLLLGLLTSQLTAQIDYDVFPEVTTTYLINDVHIQKSPLDSFGLGDILIKEGRISQISRSITAPDDAFVIEGDSAYVYPAFIAGLSHAGIAKEESKEKPKVKFRGYPPNAVVGITPEKQAFKAVDPASESIKKMKASGFAMAHIVPRGSMLPGQGSVIMLDGKSNEEMVVKESTSQFMQMQGTRGFYPATIIGVMAKWRDLYNQAGYLDKHKGIVAQSPFAKRAKKDVSLEALIPLTKKQVPLIVKANKVKDIHKALALKKELGYNLMLTEVKQGWTLIDRLKSEQVAVLLSTKLPKEDKSDKKDEKKGDKKDKKKTGDKEKGEKKDKAGDGIKGKVDAAKSKKGKKKAKKKEKPKDPEVEALEARRKAAHKQYLSQAAEFEKAGVPFAFSFLDGKPGEIKKALTRMIKNGLSESAALAALTTNPARLLGMEKEVGTLDNGKLANLFLSDAPYFEKESNIKMLFVEGKMTEFEVKKKKKKEAGDASDDFKTNLMGTWDYEVETPGGAFTGNIIVEGKEDLKVTITDSDEPDDPMVGRDISVGDETLTFTMDVDMGAMSVPAELELTFNGDSYSGTVSMEGMGSMPISGSKISAPERYRRLFKQHNHKH